MDAAARDHFAMDKKIRVLFVCLGNICRSPMAEAVFAHKVRTAGLDEVILVDSAGTGDWHIGETAHQGTRQVLTAHGINHDHRARQIARRDLDDFDYVLTMDEQNFRDVAALGAGTARVHRFLDYAPHLDVREVPDPWYDDRFEYVYSLVGEAADGLLAAIRKDHGI
jgi:protein-tyrosine phosphatase